MESPKKQAVSRVQTATGVPPNTESSTLVEPTNQASTASGGGSRNQLTVPLEGRHRSDSVSSFGSCRSAFSNETVSRNVEAEAERLKIVEMRDGQRELFPQMEQELKNMLEACESQRNVSMTIKNGLKAVRNMVERVQKIHKEVDELEARYAKHLVWNEEARADRRQIRERVQAKLIRDTLRPVCQKRGRNADSPEEKQMKKLKNKTQAEDTQGLIQDVRIQVPPRDAQMDKRKNEERKKSKVFVKIAQGQTYASVLNRIRRGVNLDATNTKVLAARRTQNGDLLLHVDKDTDKSTFVGALQNVVQEAAVVARRGPPATLEIRDLDELTEEDEVKAALRNALQTPDDERTVLLLGPNKAGLKMAVIKMEEEEARKLLNSGTIRIGFTSCRIRKRVTVLRCYRCQGFGHQSKNCTEDRSNHCYKCGGHGHKKAECTNPAHCFLCEKAGIVEQNHTAGSGKCSVFRKILETERTKARMKR